MIPTNCIACADATGKMVYNKINRRAVGPADVHIEVTYSGICHSDIHTAKGEWGDVSKKYPLCVGHEILGTVKAIGKDVTKFKVCKGDCFCVVGLVVCLVSVCGSWCVRLCVYLCGSMCMWLWTLWLWTRSARQWVATLRKSRVKCQLVHFCTCVWGGMVSVMR